ncbi:MAG: hypothetical protein HYX51_00790 [Chloroflexi bacterium]|nr:hypothetical protein [Chloroflexota bacterium]
MVAKDTPRVSESVVRIVNPTGRELEFVLEPWGETFAMPPHAEFVIVGSGPPGDGPEVSYDDEVITVWGWPGSVLRVFHDDRELGRVGGKRIPMPAPVSTLPMSHEAADAGTRDSRLAGKRRKNTLGPH